MGRLNLGTNRAGEWTRREIDAERSDGFFDQSGPETTGAYAYAQGRTVHQRFHSLQVGIEDASRLVVGVTDVIS
jgi:hypothetical protein